MTKSIDIQLVTSDLSPEVLAEMWSVYKPYYHYSEEYFRSRTGNNTHYALYRLQGRIVGFSGLRILPLEVEGKSYFTIYFGQCVVTNEVRCCGLINRTALLLLKKFWKELLTKRTVFWADALSYRAYLVFAKNLRSYYPSVKEALPAEIESLRNQLGEKYYADRYCPVEGTVRKDTYLIRDPKVSITPEKLADPDICFYAQANPKHVEGYGLLTLGPVSGTNLLFMIKKSISKAVQNRIKQLEVRKQIAPTPAF